MVIGDYTVDQVIEYTAGARRSANGSRRSARRLNLSTVSVLQMQRRWRSQRWFSVRSTRAL